MPTRSSQYIDNLIVAVDNIPIMDSLSAARVLSLYIKVLNDDSGYVANISSKYIEDYDGRAFHKKWKRHFDQMYEMFLKNSINESERRAIFKNVARRVHRIPNTAPEMKSLACVVIEETKKNLKSRRLAEVREALVAKFKGAVKKYLNLTFTLGYNEPSLCMLTLARQHKIDKYIMSGDFPIILLPFLPELEAEIRAAYEHYEMKDAWEVLCGRYFNHKAEYATLALEIKSTFNKSIQNFSQYFDTIYTNTYYKLKLEGKG